MTNEQLYSAEQVCKELNISMWTLSNWYNWEKKRIANGEESYLPQPIKLEHTKGTPRRWTKKMITELKKYKDSIVVGRNGVYGMYSNPMHKETKKYKKSIETVENE